jgi:hypothetical protein
MPTALLLTLLTSTVGAATADRHVLADWLRLPDLPPRVHVVLIV